MAKYVLVAVIALTLCLSVQTKKSKGSHKVNTECRSVDWVPYDEDWFDKNAVTGFDNRMGSKLKVGQGLNGPPTPPENKSLTYHECWSMNVRTTFGVAPIPMSFRFYIPFSRSVILKTGGTEVARLLRFFGNFVTTKTDNDTYVVGYGCLSEKTPTWTVMVPIDAKLDHDTRKEILEHVENDLGFKDLRTNQKSKSDPLAFADMYQVACKSQNDGIGKKLLGGKKG